MTGPLKVTLPGSELTPRVDTCIADVMARFPGTSASSQARYFEEVHQHLAPLARDLECEVVELKRQLEEATQRCAAAWAQLGHARRGKADGQANRSSNSSNTRSGSASAESEARLAQPSEIDLALDHIRSLVGFAYEQGFHELGYDPVAVVDSALAAANDEMPHQSAPLPASGTATGGASMHIQAGEPAQHLPVALNSLRWMLNKSSRDDSPNMRATTLLDKHHDSAGDTIRQNLEYLWRHFALTNERPTKFPDPDRPSCENPKPLTHCAAGQDGECVHPGCPQLRDGEPAATNRHCPLDTAHQDRS